MDMFETSLSPIRLGNRTLKNRIVFGAHTNNMGAAGEPSARQIEYLRARNRAGMVVVEPLPVHRSTVFARGNVDRAKMEKSNRRLRDLAAAVTENGAVGILQLIHLGQHGDGEVSFLPNWSPSGLPSFIGSTGSHEMTEEEIEEVIGAFVDSAMLAQKVGFHGVDLFANYQGLIEQFWTPWFNRRQDDWGGDINGRARLSLEILRRIKQSCGRDFITGLSISYLDKPGITLTQEELAEIILLHDSEELIDYVSCGTGGYLDTSQLVPPAEKGHSLGLPLAELLKSKGLRSIVQAESGFRDPEHVEAALAQGLTDLVSLVRAQIADPDYITKLRSGASDGIRPCLGCNQKCIGRRARDKWISCVVNPAAGREWSVMPTMAPRTQSNAKVIIVGAGPAGLALAGQLGQTGHSVEVFDQSEFAGGLPAIFGKYPRNYRWLQYVQWLVAQASDANCSIELGARMEWKDMADLDADAIVWATGARQNPAPLQRAALEAAPIREATNAMDVAAALRHPERLGHNILFVDDHHGFSGLPSALHLAELGHQVTLISGRPMVGQDLAVLGTLGSHRKAFRASAGKEIVDTVLIDWDGGRATLQDLLTGQKFEHDFDSLVWSDVPVSANQSAPSRTFGNDRRIHVLGDAYAPRDVSSAIYDAHELAKTLWH